MSENIRVRPHPIRVTPGRWALHLAEDLKHLKFGYYVSRMWKGRRFAKRSTERNNPALEETIQIAGTSRFAAEDIAITKIAIAEPAPDVVGSLGRAA